MDETLQQHACTCDVDELDEFCKIFKFEHEKYFSRNFLIFSSFYIIRSGMSTDTCRM